MNELGQILGIQLPKNIKISSVVNTTDKVIKDSIFLDYKAQECMAVDMLIRH